MSKIINQGNIYYLSLFLKSFYIEDNERSDFLNLLNSIYNVDIIYHILKIATIYTSILVVLINILELFVIRL